MSREITLAPLTERLANGQFGITLDKLLNDSAQHVAVRLLKSLCACGCDEPVPSGRKYVSQSHYNRGRGLAPEQIEQLVANFRAGTPKRQLAKEYGIALTTVKRLIRKRASSHPGG